MTDRRSLPLNGLRAFEAAARHMSFTHAAGELCVTQSAISHQIRTLETRLGVKLFRRVGQSGLELSEAGHLLLPVARDAFDRLESGLEAVLRREGAAGVLTVSVSPYFASKWLLPRVDRLRARYPELDLRLSANQWYADFAREDVDAAIRHGLGGWEGVRADRLFDDDVFPVCSPKLLEGPHPPITLGALAHHVLLHDERYDYWGQWLTAMGRPELSPGLAPAAKRLIFDDIGLVIEAAINGQGIAIGRATLVHHELAAGRLVRPFQEPVPSRYGYFLVYPDGSADRPKIRMLHDWLSEEGQRWMAELGA